MKYINANNSKIFLLFLLIASSYFFINKIDEVSIQYYDQAFERASIAFVVARTLNAIISVAQSLTVTPVIGELSLGEILDPINDMIERFSLVMLIVTIVIGVQKLLLEIGITINYVYPTLIALILFIISFRCNDKSKTFIYVLVRNILLLVFFIRFLIPTYGYICNEISDKFLKHRVQNSIESIERCQNRIIGLDFIKHPNDSLDEVKINGEYIIEHTIVLMIIFILEIILLPLFLLFFTNKFLFSLRS